MAICVVCATESCYSGATATAIPAFQYSRATNTSPTRCRHRIGLSREICWAIQLVEVVRSCDPSGPGPARQWRRPASRPVRRRSWKPIEDTPPIDAATNGHIQLNSFGVSPRTLIRKLTVPKICWLTRRCQSARSANSAPSCGVPSVTMLRSGRHLLHSRATMPPLLCPTAIVDAGSPAPPDCRVSPLVLVPVAPVQVCGVRRDSKLLFKSRGGIAPGVRAACQAMNEHRRHILRSGYACVRGDMTDATATLRTSRRIVAAPIIGHRPSPPCRWSSSR